MDEIHPKIGKREDPVAGLVDAVEVFVNDRDLREVVREAELPFARREDKLGLAGDYDGLPPEAVFLPSRRLLGEPDGRWDDQRGKVAVLGCGCGDVGCWPLLVRITETDNRMIWHDFEQPHRRGRFGETIWEYERLGPFVFDRARYAAEISKPWEEARRS